MCCSPLCRYWIEKRLRKCRKANPENMALPKKIFFACEVDKKGEAMVRLPQHQQVELFPEASFMNVQFC